MKANSSFIANRKLRTTLPSTHALILMELVQRIDGLITTGIYCLVNDRLLLAGALSVQQLKAWDRKIQLKGHIPAPVILTNAFTIVVVIQSIIMIIILKTRVIKRALTKRKSKTCHITHTPGHCIKDIVLHSVWLVHKTSYILLLSQSVVVLCCIC